MTLESIFNNASSIMTVISFITFLGILCWLYLYKQRADFVDMANLPLMDEWEEETNKPVEKRHG